MAYQIVNMDDIEVTSQIERNILEKIGKLDKYLTHLDDDTFFTRIQLSRDQRNPRWTHAQVHLTLPNGLLLGRGESRSPVHAVHLAVLELERQLEEYKQRQHPDNPMI
jgi:ribosomal subunit interface protein